jgi:hypothetical protein
MAAWINAHGGFVAGLCLFGVHVTFTMWQEVRRRDEGWRLRAIELGLVLAFTSAATLVNPYGPTLLSWVSDSLTWPRPEISEWWPVPLWTFEYTSFKVLVIVAALAVAWSRRPCRGSELAMLALAGWQAFQHQRHIPLFVILVAFWVPDHLDDALQRLRAWLATHTSEKPADVGSQRLYRRMLGVLAAIFAAITAWQVHWLRVDKADYPVSAFQFIHDRGLRGRMVTEFNWGQYCLYAFWPRILISSDGRFDTSYSRETLDLNLDFIIGDDPRGRHRSPRSEPFRRDRVLDVGGPTLALVNRHRRECAQAIAERPDWVLLYQDALAQVWGRRSVYDDRASPDYLPHEFRKITDEVQVGCVPYPALPVGADRRS